MCGIVGALAYDEFDDKKMEKIRQEAMIFFTTELLQLTQVRGKDATGIATLFSSCDYMGLKMGVSALEFTSRFGEKNTDYEGFLKVWRGKGSPAKAVIGHCRKPTTGGNAGAEDNVNNHPIKIGDIVGVHNGTISNSENILKNLGGERDGKVDSEAIFRLIHKITNNGTEPFTLKGMEELTKRLHGAFSCLAFSGNNPFQVIGFLDGRPMVMAMIRPLKLLLIASEADFLKQAMFLYNKHARLYCSNLIKFPPILKGDIETKTALPGTNFIFDLRKQIDDQTKIEDLYEEGKISINGKLWGNATKTVVQYSTNNYQNNTPGYLPNNNYTQQTNKPAVNQGNGNVATDEKKTAFNTGQQTRALDSSKDNRHGMAFNKDSGKYESTAKTETDSVDIYENIEDALIIDAETGEVVTANDDKVVMGGKKKTTEEKASFSKSNLSLLERSTPVDDLVGGAVKKIENIIMKDTQNKGTEKNNGIYSLHRNSQPQIPKQESMGQTIEEVNFKAYPDVIEMADAIAKREPSFSNTEEMANALEIKSEEVLKHMEPHSLGNRIKRFFLRKGYYLGYVAALEDSGHDDNVARTMLKRTIGKVNSTGKVVKELKLMAQILTDLVPKDGGLTERIDKAVTKTFENRQPIHSSTLKKIFKNRDFEGNEVLSRFLLITGDKENR